MKLMRPLAETTDTVTLSRADYEALLNAKEDAMDLAAFQQQQALEESIGKAAARADYLPIEVVDRLIAGESPVRVWREHRGLTLRAVAEDARVSVSYLSEIENGRKPGSAAALHAIAVTLRVPMESLL